MSTGSQRVSVYCPIIKLVKGVKTSIRIALSHIIRKSVCFVVCICENINCAVSARLISGVYSFKNKTIQLL